MRSPVAILLIAGLLFLGACSLLGSDPPALEPGDLTIQTDAQDYAPTDTVTVTFTNHSAADLLLMSAGCDAQDDKPLPDLRLSKRMEGSWEEAKDRECMIQVHQGPVQIESGKAYSVQFRIHVLDEPLGQAYRYRFDVRYEKNDKVGKQLPKEHRLSNTFELNEQ